MSNELKQHARDYLTEFAREQSPWLRALIFDSLNTNGKVPAQKLNEIYTCLKNDKEVQLPSLNVQPTSDSQNIVLKTLEHVNGVNALSSGQTIKFSDNVTILYGSNGSGKTGYFRVLNEIIGGNEQKEIFPDIYQDQHGNILVKLTYSNAQDHEVVFDESKRGFEALKRCKVFDSSYLSGLLAQRNQAETVLEPLGLHLFKYIANRIDEFKYRLKSDADILRKDKPFIKYENLSEKIQKELSEHNLSERTAKFLRDNFVFLEEKKTQLESKQNELNTLKQTNYSDRIFVLETENAELQKIIKFLKKKEQFERMLSEIKELIKLKNEKEDANKKRLEEISILKELPLSDTEEWKNFISAGDVLNKKYKVDSKNCIYCNQPLQEDAFKLIQAYAGYLKDKSEAELQTAKKDLNHAKDRVEEISVKLDVPDSLKHIPQNTDTSFNTALDEAQKSIESFKSYLLSLIKGKDTEKPKINVMPQLLEWIDNKRNKNTADIESINAEKAKKEEKVSSLEEEIEKLLENQAISEQKTEIENWMKIHQDEKGLREKESEIDTRAITYLSKTAHDELLTEGLNSAFQEELIQLGCEYIEVELVKAGGVKGDSSTKLTLKDGYTIRSILSEGEQKAVGLALFIAEATIQKANVPIILDDPVNSLDHRIATDFANRLLSLENQIIIFNHNRLFQDAFETAKSGHLCKRIDEVCSKQGKHILVHDVKSEGKSMKGVLSFYKDNSSQNHIDAAKNELMKSPFKEDEKVAILLRKAVECLIDETVLNNVIPTKYSNKNNPIRWDKLKKLRNDPAIIEKLKKIYDRVSGGILHSGTESESNPIGVDEFNQFVRDLESVSRGNYQ